MKVESETPLVSIGLPVYNGEKYIRQAIEAILNQDYQNIELVISDNSSTDQTGEICREYQQKDPRIRYYRNAENLGSAKNFKQVFELSKARYFMWAAHDDYFESAFISGCLARLQENPDAVLCCSEVNFIDEQGQIKTDPAFSEFKNIDTAGMDIPGRVRRLLSVIGWVAIYGIIRRSALEKVLLDNPSYGFDVILLLELLLQGDIIKVPEKLFCYRIADRQKTTKEYMVDIAPANIGQAPDKPMTYLYRELFKTVIASELDYETKVKAYRVFSEMLEFQATGWMPAIMNENSPAEQTAVFIKGLLLPEEIFLDYLLLNDKNFSKAGLPKNEASNVSSPEKYFYNNGLLHLSQERYREALDSFAKSAEMGMRNYDIFSNLALCLEKLGDHKTAQIYYQKAQGLKKTAGSDK
jgi:glycosyltransferase involved in cell wall biosynthesis